MLEDEGIKFEPDGKIKDEYFVRATVCTKKRKGKTTTAATAAATTKQPALSIVVAATATTATTATTAATATATTATAVDEITKEMLKREILDLLNKRAPNKTC
jgi:hypothetical protein